MSVYLPYPLEQIARSAHTRFQTGFARMASHLLPDLEDVAYETSSHGLKILAGDESALATPVEILRQAYGADVEIAPARVRLIRETGIVKEPVMTLRIDVSPADVQRVLKDLEQREVVLHDVAVQEPGASIRAQAPLRKLLGYQQTLDALTNDSARLSLSISHYAPVWSGPDGDAA
ncbi:MAG TPA: hypothetical protein VIQ62_11650 [Burkholderiales bacterium]